MADKKDLDRMMDKVFDQRDEKYRDVKQLKSDCAHLLQDEDDLLEKDRLYIYRLKKKLEKRDKKLELYDKEFRKARAVEHERLKQFKSGT